jgi:tetratricopeptide (TPR) repeat protein
LLGGTVDRPVSSARTNMREYTQAVPPSRLISVAVVEHDREDAVSWSFLMNVVADRHLLFGLLALQNGIINQSQLLAAFQAWALDKARSLADHLEAHGDLTRAKRTLLEALAEIHLETHGGNVEKSLAAVSVGKSTRVSLARIGDADIEATLGHVGSGAGATDGDADLTGSYSVGSATSDGQRFRILRPHARGGLGAVFVALDGELHREVALKQILDRHADDPTCRSRFLLEAEITGGLEHPGVVPVYGVGTYGDGRPYYAMRFIRGDSLKEAVERFHGDKDLTRDAGRRSFELRKLLRRFLDVCNAIDYAHSRGVLHRDIKPANVIVGKHGETLVVDWGLAKAVGKADCDPTAAERPLSPSSGGSSAETLPGSALGTPAYMCPEQARGDLTALGPPSDVYSLGATLYCVLTGQAPFEGEVGEVLRRVQVGDFPPPRQLDSTIDRAVEAVCLKAMATDPRLRYPSARALADDIERWTADQTVSAYRDPAHVRLARAARRHRTGVAVVAGLVQTAVVVLAVSTVLLGQSRARIDRERGRAEAVNKFLVNDLLAQADPENNPAGDRLTVRELLNKAAAAVESSPALKGREDVEGAIRSTVGSAFFGLGLYQSAEQQLARAVECQEKTAAVVPELERLITLNRYLWVVYKNHKYDGLGSRLEAARANCTRTLGQEHEESIYAADSLASYYISSGSPSRAFPIFRRNLEIQTRLHGHEHKLTLIAASNLASGLLNSSGRPGEPTHKEFVTEAETLAHSFRTAAVHGPNPESVEVLYLAVHEGRALVLQGKFAAAAALLSPLQERFTRVLGPHNLETAAALFQLGLAEEGLGHPDRAEPLIRKAYEGRRDGLGPGIYMTQECHGALIRVEFALGKLPVAASLIRELMGNPAFYMGVVPSVATPSVDVPAVDDLVAALAGKGDPYTVMTTLNRVRKALGAPVWASRDDWLNAHLSCLALDCMDRLGQAAESTDAFQTYIAILEKNPATPARILAEDRERAERLRHSRPARSAGAAAGGRP